ncbi:MAG: helix-turn-helix domain-containing protein, partial [Pseudomonadota bacterium]
MNAHKNARTTPYIRALMVASYHSGDPVSSIAQRFGVSVNTVYKWLKRHRGAGAEGLINRSSRPKRSGRAHPDGWHQLIIWLRRELRMTAACIAEHLNLPRSTVARWMSNAGLARQRDLVDPAPIRRYQHACPGD